MDDLYVLLTIGFITGTSAITSNSSSISTATSFLTFTTTTATISNLTTTSINTTPQNPPFICDFNQFSILGSSSCYGILYETTNDAKISSFDVDLLVGTKTYITDFTSIGKYIYIFQHLQA